MNTREDLKKALCGIKKTCLDLTFDLKHGIIALANVWVFENAKKKKTLRIEVGKSWLDMAIPVRERSVSPLHVLLCIEC